MKTLTNFIQEKFLIDNDIIAYTCQPKDKFELRDILKERLAKDKNANLNDIDVSQILDMGAKGSYNGDGLFEYLDPHNIDISGWDVSNVTDMRDMFRDCTNFTGKGLENWDVSKVTTMKSMFYNCENFAGKGLENWDVSKVTNMNHMFYNCKNFNINLNNWKMSNVLDTAKMFYGCEKFDCNLSNWDVSKVKNMRWMFRSCKNFTGKGLENWNISTSIEDISSMFFNCDSLKNFPSWYDV